jgi:hypothetical protein
MEDKRFFSLLFHDVTALHLEEYCPLSRKVHYLTVIFIVLDQHSAPPTFLFDVRHSEDKTLLGPRSYLEPVVIRNDLHYGHVTPRIVDNNALITEDNSLAKDIAVFTYFQQRYLYIDDSEKTIYLPSVCPIHGYPRLR